MKIPQKKLRIPKKKPRKINQQKKTQILSSKKTKKKTKFLSSKKSIKGGGFLLFRPYHFKMSRLLLQNKEKNSTLSSINELGEVVYHTNLFPVNELVNPVVNGFNKLIVPVPKKSQNFFDGYQGYVAFFNGECECNKSSPYCKCKLIRASFFRVKNNGEYKEFKDKPVYPFSSIRLINFTYGMDFFLTKGFFTVSDIFDAVKKVREEYCNKIVPDKYHNNFEGLDYDVELGGFVVRWLKLD